MTTEPPKLTFTHEELDPIEGRPSAASIAVLREQVYANAMAIPSNLGGGAYGHLGIVMPAAEYNAMANAIAYVTPAHPGAQPAPEGNTAVQITQANRLYDTSQATFQLHNTTEQAIKKQILAAVDHKYTSLLKHRTLGYANVTAMALMAHLTTRYDITDSETLEKNRSSLSADWNPDDTMEALYRRMQAVQDFAALAGNEHRIPDAAAINLILQVIERSGQFTRACSEWRKRPQNEQTMLNFRNDMDFAWKERDRQATSKDHDYKALQTVEEPKVEEANNAEISQPTILVDDIIKMYYCWTHGLGFSSGHTSCTCKKKAEGHRDEATIKKRLGGSNRIQAERSYNSSR